MGKQGHEATRRLHTPPRAAPSPSLTAFVVNLLHWDDLAPEIPCESFSGAELEQAVVASLYEAYNDGQPLATEHLPNEAAATQPLSVVMAERLAGLRAWGADRAVMAH